MEKTGSEKITYIGHSQGTTQMLVALMAFPEFFRKHMQLFVAIAPVLYLKDMTAEIFTIMGENEKILKTIYE
jgi:pimeloyl-ACP methyl ester carboxylesterase